MTMNNDNITVEQVQEHLKKGHFNEAIGVAKQILDTNPNDVFCLSIVAQNDFNQGNFEEATNNLKKALDLKPKELNLNRNLGIIYNKQGKFKESVEAFSQGIENNKEHPGILLDVLLLGISMDKISKPKAARIIEFVFHKAKKLRSAYMNRQELPFIAETSMIGNGIIRDARFALQKQAVDEISLGFEEGEKSRLYDFLDSFHGLQQPKYAHEQQKPSYHVFPDLEPITFYNNEQFSWVKLLEENADEIKNELNQLYLNNVEIKPYVSGSSTTGNTGLDVLVDSLDWSSIHLIQAGNYKNDILDKCPITHSILKQLPMPVLAGNGPEVFLSVLKPGTEIKPHYGLSNIKLTVHLGLEIPDNCAIKVGNDIQSWSNGKVTVFDDSFEHSAWNRSDEERKVLIIEVWNPYLSPLEIQGIQKIMELQHNTSLVAQTDNLETLVFNSDLLA